MRVAALALLVACQSGASAPAPRPAPANAAVPIANDDLDILRPERVQFASGALVLHGYLWTPPGPGPFPAIVLNHGSEPDPGDKFGMARTYLKHGFVVFVPHRRGHGESSTAAPYLAHQYDRSGPDPKAVTDELVAQTDDVMAAVAYTAKLPNVDPARIATIGCSFGGIEALLAAERGDGLVATVDFAGAAMTWATFEPLRDRMLLAARNARVPVFFVQAENDFNTAPSTELAAAMDTAGKPHRVHVFPPSGDPLDPKDGHHFCIGGKHPAWEGEVFEFLDDAMKPHAR